MKFHHTFFNIILLLAAGFFAGCTTTDSSKKELTAIRLHLEARNFGADGRTEPVPIFRENPVLVNVQRAPFADERDLETAEVIEWMGGSAIRLTFNRHGALMLEDLTRRDAQRRIAINCTFDTESRWLAAPIIGRPIANGILTFTPDASAEETGRIVRGLSNAIAQIKKKSK